VEETLTSRTAVLKLLMSYPVEGNLQVTYDSVRMRDEIISFDTLQSLDINNRIEYQQLLTQKRLEEDNLKYFKWGFLPEVSLFGQYNLNYYNNQFKDLYTQNYPNSYAGLSVTLPLFTGTRRVQEVRIAKLRIDRLDYNFNSLRDSIRTQYRGHLHSKQTLTIIMNRNKIWSWPAKCIMSSSCNTVQNKNIFGCSIQQQLLFHLSQSYKCDLSCIK
jgi:outer membrane protein TolC